MIQTKQEKAFEYFASAVMILVMAIVIFPFILLFVSSITEENGIGGPGGVPAVSAESARQIFLQLCDPLYNAV